MTSDISCQYQKTRLFSLRQRLNNGSQTRLLLKTTIVWAPASEKILEKDARITPPGNTGAQIFDLFRWPRKR